MHAVCGVRECYRRVSQQPRRRITFEGGDVKPTCHPCYVQWSRLFDYEDVPPAPVDLNYYDYYTVYDAERRLRCAICYELTDHTPHMMCEHVEPKLCAHTVHVACLGLSTARAKYFCKHHKGEADALSGYSLGGSHPGLGSEWYHKDVPVSSATILSPSNASTQEASTALYQTSSLEWWQEQQQQEQQQQEQQQDVGSYSDDMDGSDLQQQQEQQHDVGSYFDDMDGSDLQQQQEQQHDVGSYFDDMDESDPLLKLYEQLLEEQQPQQYCSMGGNPLLVENAETGQAGHWDGNGVPGLNGNVGDPPRFNSFEQIQDESYLFWGDAFVRQRMIDEAQGVYTHWQ